MIDDRDLRWLPNDMMPSDFCRLVLSDEFRNEHAKFLEECVYRACCVAFFRARERLIYGRSEPSNDEEDVCKVCAQQLAVDQDDLDDWIIATSGLDKTEWVFALFLEGAEALRRTQMEAEQQVAGEPANEN